MAVQQAPWLEALVRRTAGEIAAAGNTIRHFERVIAEKLAEAPFTDWELSRWTRGLGRGLIVMNPPLFRMGAGKFSSYHFFVRNEAGLLVGLRRESFTQAAAYVSLVTDYGHARRRVRFETEFLDVAVRDEAGRLALYAESKAADRTLLKLVEKLTADFADGLPPMANDKLPPDPWQKAGHILRARPRHFWAVSPGLRLAYTVDYRDHGFRLRPLKDIPKVLQEVSLAYA